MSNTPRNDDRCPLRVPLALPVSSDLATGHQQQSARRWQNQWHTIVGLAVVALIGGCSHEQKPAIAPNEMVYIDTITKTAMTLPVQTAVPATNPQTGKKTLVPGLYCPQCGQWYPAPPVEVLQRSASAFRCPKGGHEMSPNGPRPPTI